MNKIDSKLIILLKLINANADVSFLLKQGLTYSQITSILGEAYNRGFIEQSDVGIKITQLGNNIINTSNFNGDGPNWIYPDNTFSTESSGIDDIFLPRIKESFFK